MLQVCLIGPLEVRRDGTVLAVPGGKTAEVLVRLALEAGVVVRAERLVEDLWSDQAVHTKPNTLQSKITRLRRALGQPSPVLSIDHGYGLQIDPAEVDAVAVLQAVAASARMLERHEDRAVRDRCATALARFRGDILPAATGVWAESWRAQLEQARVALLETGFAARARLGEAGQLISPLEAAVETSPYREGLWELLITALYRAGRQADALNTYQRVRTVLGEQLGLEPGPRLRAIEQQILNHDRALQGDHQQAAAMEIVSHGPTSSMSIDRPPTSNLPTLTSELVGRNNELVAIGQLLATQRLVTVVGPGGVGKTALAIAAGRERHHTVDTDTGGIWLIRLEAATNPGEVLDGLIATLGVSGAEAALLERLRAQPTLLILDNCEHVVDAVAELTTRLLDAAPTLRVLATSQTPLDIDGERLLELAPLDTADATELFDQRCRTHGRSRPVESGADIGGDIGGDIGEDIAVLCRALDGLPLAIELAAARTRTLSIAEISRRLDDRFNLLHDPASRRPERRRALRSTIGWSYDLLFPDDQRGLWALSAFAGGASLAALEHVLAALEVPAGSTIDVLGRLAARSLLVVDEGTDGSVRYRLLDSIRAYAREVMIEAGMHEPAHAAHARWLAMVARTNTAGVRSAAQAEHLAITRAERANIDAALAWCATHDPPLGLDIAVGFGWAWIVLGDVRGSQRLLGALAAAGDSVNVQDRATALLLAAWIDASTGRLDAALAHVTAAELHAADNDHDVDLQARCWSYRAYIVCHQGHWQQGMDLTAAAADLYDSLDRPWDQLANALFAARAAVGAGDATAATRACDSVRHWQVRSQDPWLSVRAEAVFGEFARLEHRFDDAVAHLSQAAATSNRLGFRQTEAYQLSALGRAQCQAGNYQQGLQTLQLAVAKAETIGDVRMAALGRVHLGRVLRALGRDPEAREALAAAANWHRQAGGGEQAALGDCLIAAMDARAGRPDAADRLEVLLEVARNTGDAAVEVFALDALARLATAAGNTAAADAHRLAADHRMGAARHFITEADRVDNHR
ncbi:MAG: AfsR/SARP family transcriptional regulator [Acidimicrobiales bacterium]